MSSNSEEWKRLVSSLSDQFFTDLARNYLGDIKSLSNRQRLTDKLREFLTEPENTERILSLIDEKDASLLTAVSILGCSTPGALYTLFAPEQSYLDFYKHLINLEERMLLCRDGGKVVISPLFRDILEERIIDTDMFIGCVPCRPETGDFPPWYSPSALSAFFSYLLRGGSLFRNDFSFRKKYAGELKALLAPSFAGGDGDACVEYLRRFFIENNLVRVSDKKITPVMPVIKEFLELTPEKQKQLVLRTVTGNTSAAACFLENISPDRSCSEKALARLLRCCCAASGAAECRYEEIRDTLAGAALIVKTGNSWHAAAEWDHREPGRFVVQPNSSVYVSGNVSLRDNMFLALCADIREMDFVSRYEITRESFFRALASGIDARSFIEFLEEKSGSTLPQNILFSLRSWESEFNSISVDRGFVVKVDDRFRPVLESNRSFNARIKEKLAEGVYFVPEENMEWVSRYLKTLSGCEFMAHSEEKGTFPPLSVRGSVPGLRFSSGGRKRTGSGTWDPEIHERKIAELNIFPEQKEILRERVRSRLILSETQLDSENIRYEKNEARGIDYNGKLRLCEQVVRNGGYYLEILLAGEKRGIMLEPQGLRKTEGDHVLSGIVVGDGEKTEIYIRKIGVVRRIRISFND